MKILVADENRASRILLANIFKLKNYEVMDAKDSGEVVDLYKENQDTDVILASSTLPKGIDTVVNSLHGDKGHPYLIIMVENRNNGTNIDHLKIMSDDIVFKPLVSEIIESKLELAREEIKNGFNGEDFDPIEELIREHRLMERTVNTYQKIASKINGDVDKIILAWMNDAALTIERRLHHRKERHFMVNFLEKAISLEGENPDDKLFNRASLKSVEEEHEIIDKIFKKLQYEILRQVKGQSNCGSLKQAINDYAEILKDHINREERFLLPASRKYIDQEMKKRLRVEFNKEEKRIGKDTLNKFEHLLSRVEEVL